MTPESLLNESENLLDEMIFDRRFLHSHPGTGFDIKETVSYVKEKLVEMGCNPEECGKAGLIATIGGRQETGSDQPAMICGGQEDNKDQSATAVSKKAGRVFLLRADMDALPIHEEADVEFAATCGKMHACGHDMHTAMLLGAARILKNHENEIKGTVKLMFQPAEESFEGSKDMIASGVLKNPEVDAAMMLHVMAGMPFPAGTAIVSSPGVSAPAADYFEIKVKGKGCHGSMPNTGIDPLSAAAHIVIALQELHARELALDDRAVLTIGTFNAGNASNVIPDTAVLGGTIRTFDEETRAFLKQRMLEISKGTATAFRAEAEVTFGSGCPTLINDKELSEQTFKYIKELLGENRAFSIAQLNAMSDGTKSSKSAGSEDFAYVSQQVPAIMLALAAGEPDKGYIYPQHHPKVMFDENALVNGCAIYAYTAMSWLEEH